MAAGRRTPVPGPLCGIAFPGRCCGILVSCFGAHGRNLCDKAIAPTMGRFDIARIMGAIIQRLAQLPHDIFQNGIANEGFRPHGIKNLPLRHKLAATFH